MNVTAKQKLYFLCLARLLFPGCFLKSLTSGQVVGLKQHQTGFSPLITL